jgi:hypothetical protein
MAAPLSRTESAALARHRRGRNLAMLLALLALCGLFYLITLVKLAHQIP